MAILPIVINEVFLYLLVEKSQSADQHHLPATAISKSTACNVRAKVAEI
jgi:hypothetical protein